MLRSLVGSEMCIRDSLYLGALQVLDHDMSAGELSTFFLLADRVNSNMQDLLALWAMFQSAVGATRRVFQIMQAVPRLPDDGDCTPDTVRGELELKGVHLVYHGERCALRNVSLRFRAETVTALVGSSGSGKSSIGALLLRLYDPTHGSVLLDSRDLSSYPLSWLHRHICIVAQEPVLFSGTIQQNIGYGAPSPPSFHQVRHAAMVANAHDFISRLPDGYDTVVGERGCCLSGGQRQRLAIALAVIRDPKVLILDEATSALDSESEKMVRSALKQVMPGRTAIVIAHRLSTVRDADKIVVMDNGHVVEQGSHDTLVKLPKGRYRRLLEAQLDSESIDPDFCAPAEF
eukprot:TRINITY_DN12939_c0_g2_i1.p1 TRINITY_DN12939_c0_g2~~TRINITY_DN12939_c0_g2_i1.p1  ORF type:complete len:346 (-),score=58.69 TRINITY_DN12939_c0_g2_i1:68-1105(-)